METKTRDQTIQRCGADPIQEDILTQKKIQKEGFIVTDETTHLTEPGHLLAAIPAMLGFVPGESLIIIHGTNEGQMTGAVRCDLDAPDQEIQEVAEGVNFRTPEDGVCVIVLVTPSPPKAVSCMNILLRDLVIPVKEILGCTSLDPGAEYVNPLKREVKGRVPDWRESVLTTMQISQGHRIFSSEKELEAVYDPGKPVATVTDLDIHSCAVLMKQLGEAMINQKRDMLPTNGEIGSVLVYGDNARDFTLHWACTQPNFAHNVFSEVGIYTRGQARVEALTIAGVTAYLGHQGSLAQVAFVAALKTAELMNPPFESELLSLVSDSYFSGLHPDEFKNLFLTPLEGDPTQ